jgi:DNA helicase-2/ATP-dependent DNA helicase PcrA
MAEPLSTTLADLDASTSRQRAELLAAELEAAEHDADDSTPSFAELALPDTAAGHRVASFEQIVRLGHELLTQDPHTRTDAFPGWLRTVLLDEGPEASDAVTIASFHSAKGLEWDVVHLAGIEAGYVPISHARTPEAKREEERLFYVAVTRAADVLRCSWARTRTFGSDPVERAPSPFLGWVRTTVDDLGRQAAPAVEPTGLVASRSALATDEVDPVQLTATVAAGLRAWRTEQARRASVRPTVVLSDRALDELARLRPRSTEELERVGGIGPLGRERHGARLLAIVAEHLGDGPVSSDDAPASARR